MVSGGARLFKSLPDGRRQIIGFAHRGDVLPAYPCARYPYSAEAMRGVQVTCVPTPVIHHLHDTSPGACAASLQSACHLLVGMHSRLLMLGRQTARERLAAFLIGQGTRMGTHELWPVDPALSRADIADFLGLTTETVSRLLSTFHRESSSRVSVVPSTFSTRTACARSWPPRNDTQERQYQDARDYSAHDRNPAARP
ncbi:helix-turn-helix domain-containing protein [Komagataeibacter rhaeticus]|nr:helix-turn-helix domain-containing protein [Komagataeibacter rhaeticus]